jgi:hypothetical protein
MKTIAIIPVHNRLPLLKIGIKRLIEVNNVHVICVGSEAERKVCEQAGAEYVYHENQPLGKKWNAGFIAAGRHNPDACLYIGSSDWLSADWLLNALPMLEEYDLVGQAGCHFMDVNKQGTSTSYRAVYWPGYGKGHEREHEPIGIGRVLSARVLKKLNWEPFKNDIPRSLDYWQMKRVQDVGGKVVMMPCGVAMSISTNLWENMHKFEQHWSNVLPSERVAVNDLIKLFPEITQL